MSLLRFIIISISICICFCLFFVGTTGYASTYIDVGDEVVYTLLSRLEAEGIIKSGLLDTKPISRKEAARLLHEAEANSASSPEFIKSLVRSLKDRLGPDPSSSTEVKPIDTIYVKYIHTNADDYAGKYSNALENEQPMNYNNNGDLYKRGSNERIGFTSRLEDWGPLSIEFNPEYRYPSASYTGYPANTLYSKDEMVVNKAYAVFDLGWDVVIGKDSQWWGPGYNGALLLTNNAEPLTILKLTNPEPVRLPWIFDYLGPFRFTYFVTKLENERPVSRPYLYGMRFDFKLSQYVDFALEKTAIIGGQGRPDDLRTWEDSILGLEGRNYQSSTWVNIDDERAGFDFKVTIPWHVQPMQIYLEADGEDKSARLPIPQSWAFLVGLYLPRILDNDRFDLRMEYVTTRGRVHDPYVWYTHGTYTSYTYEGNIIGDYVGTDASDFFTEVSYLIPERNGRIFLSYNKEEHNFYFTGAHETLDELTKGVVLSLTKHIDLTAQYSFGIWKNRGNVSGDTTRLTAFSTEVGYRF